MKKFLKGFLIGFICLFYTNISVNALSLKEYEISCTTKEPYKIEILQHEGEVTFESSDETIFTVNEEGVITPKKDGIALLTIKDDQVEYIVSVFITAFGTITDKMEEIYNSLPDSIELNVAKQVLTTDKNNPQYYWKDYESTQIYYLISEYNKDENYVIGNVKFENNTATLDIETNFQIEDKNNITYYTKSIKYPKSKTITINYKDGNEKDLTLVKNTTKNVKKKYTSYMNYIFKDLFYKNHDEYEKIVLKNSDLEKDLNNKNIIYKMDSRAGTDFSYNSFFKGYLQLGINDIMYDVTEVEFHNVLKIPKIKDPKNTIKEIKEYFENNLITSNESVEITDKGNNVFTATITEKNISTNILTGKIMNFFIQSVNADTEKEITFSIEEVDEEEKIENNSIENPKTNDNITIYFYLIIISILSLNILKKLYKTN